MSALRWSSDRYDQLESATRLGRRVVLERRGTEYVVIAVDLRVVGARESLIGRLPMTGEELTFALEDLTAFQVLDPEDG